MVLGQTKILRTASAAGVSRRTAPRAWRISGRSSKARLRAYIATGPQVARPTKLCSNALGPRGALPLVPPSGSAAGHRGTTATIRRMAPLSAN